MTWTRIIPTAAEREAEKNRRMRERLEGMRMAPRLNVGTYAGATAGPAPKENPLESAAYEDAVRNLGFCVRCGRTCRPQFCHRDQGKGQGMKTDVRGGWAGCGPGAWGNGCHYIVGTAGALAKETRRVEEDRLAALTREALRRRGTWPKSVPMWEN